MKHPEFLCTACGSANLRRSHSTSLRDLPNMALGNYPFRCLDCRARLWINVWFFSKGSRAICPRCLSLDVLPAEPQRMRLGLWRKLLLAIGARGYRCETCNFRFVSFKRRQRPEIPGSPRKLGSKDAALVSVADTAR